MDSPERHLQATALATERTADAVSEMSDAAKARYDDLSGLLLHGPLQHVSSIERSLRHIRAILVFIALLLLASLAAHAAPRSHAAKAAFQRATPCPTTGATRGGCPGHVIDHVVPLCAGGPDAPANMQWQTVDDAKVKDREEAKLCRSLRRA